VARDGDTDLVFHLRRRKTNLTCDCREASLPGKAFGSQAIEGTDTVRMVSGR
jgi:hypothetical protein